MNLSKLLINFAAASADDDVLASLGIDWVLLVIQLVAFLILVAVLAKFVYPVFLRILDQREAAAQESAEAAESARQQAEKAESEVKKLLDKARKDASQIVATAKDEANATIEKAEDRANARADKIVADAKEQIDKQIISAKKALHNETLDLVAEATEKVLVGISSAKVDTQVIEKAIKDSK